MASATLKRPRIDYRMKSVKKNKKVKRQTKYHSSSDESESEQEDEADFTTANVKEADEDKRISGFNPKGKDEEEEESDDSDSSTQALSTTASLKRKKRNDPEAFATSISKILGSKLTTSKRADPVLSRSKDNSINTKEFVDAKLEAKARHKIREEKRQALDRGRVTDIFGVESSDVNTGEVIELERRLRKTAQRGVIKLFNAVRAAQIKGEEAAKEARETGMIGISKREERATEMSKQGFLDLIAGGGKSKQSSEER